MVQMYLSPQWISVYIGSSLLLITIVGLVRNIAIDRGRKRRSEEDRETDGRTQ